MRERWFFPTIVSMALSVLAIAGVVLMLTMFSCATPAPAPAPDRSESLVGAEQPAGAIGTLRDLEAAFNYIGETVSQSVVRINVRERVSPNGAQEGVPFFDHFFGQPDEQEPRDRGFDLGGVGSGVIVSSDRRRYYVLTNDHVVGAADSITVELSDGTELEAQLVGRDSRKDLAMVSVESDRDLPIARLGDSDLLRVGDWVVAIGSPFGYRNTITAGIVSAMGRHGGPDGNISDFIQTDASINQGNSGGALVNLDGEVVGINTWITSDSGGSIGLGFAIPINNVVRSINEFLGDGEVEYGWLGVSIGSVDARQVAELELPGHAGALVDSIFGGSPAARAGILPGDFIYQIGDQSVINSSDLILLIGELPIGKVIDFRLIRSGEAISIPVTLAARETDAAIARQSRLRWPGISVYPLTAEIAEESGVAVDAGVIITEIDSGSPAGIGGLQIFDVVTSVNETAVVGLSSFYQIISDPTQKEWRFIGVRNRQSVEIMVVR